LSLLGPNILFNILFSNNLSVCSSLSVSNQVLYPYKWTDKIIVWYILVFTFLDRKLEDKRFCIIWWQTFTDVNLCFISSRIEFWCIQVVTNIWTVLFFQRIYYQYIYIYILWLRPAFWSRDMTMYLVLSAFTSSPVSLLATTRGSVFFFVVCMLLPNILT
jgi:hypothetical protein